MTFGIDLHDVNDVTIQELLADAGQGHYLNFDVFENVSALSIDRTQHVIDGRQTWVLRVVVKNHGPRLVRGHRANVDIPRTLLYEQLMKVLNRLDVDSTPSEIREVLRDGIVNRVVGADVDPPTVGLIAERTKKDDVLPVLRETNPPTILTSFKWHQRTQ